MPLSYECVRSKSGTGTALNSGLGSNGSDNEVVQQGAGWVRRDTASGRGSAVSQAQLCVFSRILTDSGRDFVGMAQTSANGTYRFPVDAGASRQLSVVYRQGHREIVSRATIQTIVHPTLKLREKVVYNKHFAHFVGAIPGPHNDRVVVVLQARVGKGWSAFRRYRTRGDGHFSAGYRFHRTTRRRRYIMRAQVRQTVGYPYLQGNSDRLKVLVVPGHGKRCKTQGKTSKRHCKAKPRRHGRHVKRHGSSAGR